MTTPVAVAEQMKHTHALARPAAIAIETGEPQPAGGGSVATLLLSTTRRWWRVALPVGLLTAAVSSAGIFAISKPLYRASAWLRIQSQPYVLFPEDETEKDEKRFINTQVQLIRSPMVLMPLLSEPAIARLDVVRRQSDPVSWLAATLEVEQQSGSELFRVSFPSTDPDAAVAVVNGVTQSYLGFQAEQERNLRGKRSAALQKEKNKQAESLRKIRLDLKAVAEQSAGDDPLSRLGLTGDAGDTGEDAVEKDLVRRMFAAEMAEIEARGRIAAAEQFEKNGAVSQLSRDEFDRLVEAEARRRIEEDPVVGGIQSQLMYMQQQTSSYSMLKAPTRSPSYVRLLEQSKQLEGQLRQAVESHREQAIATVLEKQAPEDSGLAKAEVDLAIALAQKERIREMIDRKVARLKQSSQEVLEIEVMKDELETGKNVQNDIATSLLQLQVEAQSNSRVELLQAGELEKTPIKSKPLKEMAAASLAGLMLPFALAVVWERLANRVSGQKCIEKHVLLPVLGEITKLPGQASRPDGRIADRYRDETLLYEESINGLAATLLLGGNFRATRTLAIASAVKGEGKTTLASQLASCMANATRKPTLLIDGDMRSPELHGLFGLNWEPGLADVLEGRAELIDVIVPTDVPGLDIIPAGRLTSSPLLLLGDCGAAFFREIPDRYDRVLIDTPPVLAASESLVLAQGADATVLCAMRDVTRGEQLKEAASRLRSAGANVVGVVLAGVAAGLYPRPYGLEQLEDELDSYEDEADVSRDSAGPVAVVARGPSGSESSPRFPK